jgi:hypothetical protein
VCCGCCTSKTVVVNLRHAHLHHMGYHHNDRKSYRFPPNMSCFHRAPRQGMQGRLCNIAHYILHKVALAHISQEQSLLAVRQTSEPSPPCTDLDLHSKSSSGLSEICWCDLSDTPTVRLAHTHTKYVYYAKLYSYTIICV